MSLRRFRFLTTVLLVSALAPGADAADFWKDVKSPGGGAYRKAIDDGRRAVRGRRFNDALEAAERAKKAMAGDPEGHALEARAAAELGDLRRADDAARRALALDPRAFANLDDAIPVAEAEAATGAFDRAAAILEPIVLRAPNGTLRRRAYALLGDLHLLRGIDDGEAALRAYREALRGATSVDVRALSGLALVLRRRGEERSARELLHGLARVEWIAIIATFALPEAERAARRAIVLETLGNEAAAVAAWAEAGSPPARRD